MGRFLNFVLFVMVVAFGLVPAAALAQQPRVVRENGRDVLLVPVRGRMDLGAVVRLANQHAAPGTTITADVVVEANPGKINFACYRSHGNHYGSRNPANWQSCPASQQQRWVVTGLVYRVPLQRSAPEQNVVSSAAPTMGAAMSPPSVQPTQASSQATDEQREAIIAIVDAAIGRAETQSDIQRRAFVQGLVTQLEIAEMRQEQEQLRYVLSCVVFAAVLVLLWALWSHLRGSKVQDRPQHAQQPAFAFAGAPAVSGPAPSLDPQPNVHVLIREAVQKEVIPIRSARDAANERVQNLESDRNAIQTQLDQALEENQELKRQLELAQKNSAAVPAVPPPKPTRISDWRDPGAFMPTAPFIAGKERLVALFNEAHSQWQALLKIRINLQILDEWPPDAPQRRADPERFAKRYARLKEREARLLPRFTGTKMGFESLLLAHTGLSLSELWETPDDLAQALLKTRTSLLQHEIEQLQGKVDRRDRRLAAANAAAELSKDEAERQSRLREEDIARLDARLREIQTEAWKKTDKLLTAFDEKQQRINELEKHLSDREVAYALQEEQFTPLSAQVLLLTGQVVDLKAELGTVASERDRFKTQVGHLKGMLDQSVGNGNGGHHEATNAPTRKTTQPFQAVQRSQASSPSGPPPSASKTRRRKT